MRMPLPCAFAYPPALARMAPRTDVGARDWISLTPPLMNKSSLARVRVRVRSHSLIAPGLQERVSGVAAG